MEHRDNLLSNTISYLRFPLSVAIVFIHFNISGGIWVDAKVYGAENPGWFVFVVNFISETLARTGVPLFFIISGFLFFYRKDFNLHVSKQKLRSRARTLLVPYILWNLLAVLWQLKCYLPGFSSFFNPVEVRISLVRLFHTFFDNAYLSGVILGPPYVQGDGIYPMDIPLWFVRDLMVMVVLSPLIYWLIKKAGAWTVAVLGLLWFFYSLVMPTHSYAYIKMLVTASFFFSCGAYFGISNVNFVDVFRKLRYVPVVYIPVAVVDALTKGLPYNVLIHNAGILLGIISAVVIVSYLLEKGKVKVSKTMANSSFFIFALHYLFISELGKVVFVLFHVPDNNPYAFLALYFAVPIITVLICLGLYLLLKKYLPKLCNLLTGGR